MFNHYAERLTQFVARISSCPDQVANIFRIRSFCSRPMVKVNFVDRRETPVGSGGGKRPVVDCEVCAAVDDYETST